MKVYLTGHQLRMTGKAWQIRHQLRKWQKENGELPLPMERFLAPYREEPRKPDLKVVKS
jgi:hypothetical protein